MGSWLHVQTLPSKRTKVSPTKKWLYSSKTISLRDFFRLLAMHRTMYFTMIYSWHPSNNFDSSFCPFSFFLYAIPFVIRSFAYHEIRHPFFAYETFFLPVQHFFEFIFFSIAITTAIIRLELDTPWSEKLIHPAFRFDLPNHSQRKN